jgi:DNA polymerase-3 subunit delta
MGKARKPTEATIPAPAPGAIRPVYVVFGADDGLRSRGLQKLLEEIGTDGSVSEFPANASLADVLDEVRTMPLLGDRRIVVVRDADPFVTAYRETLEHFLASPVPTGTLVLEPKKWPSNTRLAKLVDKIGLAVKCEVAAKDIPALLVRHAAKFGKQLQPTAAQAMRELIGDDEPAIYLSEIEKLVTYVGDRPAIVIEDVQALISPMRIEKIWGVTDAMADRNPSLAIALWEEVLAGDKEAQFRAVGGLAFGIRKLLRARRMIDRGVPIGQAVKDAGLWGDRAMARAQAFSLQQLENQLARLAKIDLSSKSGGNIRTEVQNFIVAACGVRSRSAG